MKRCNDCADRVVDTDAICTGCRMAEWRDQQEQARQAREKAYALEAHRAAYLSRKKMIRDSIKAIIGMNASRPSTMQEYHLIVRQQTLRGLP